MSASKYCCYCLCKDTNSQASHNSTNGRTTTRPVVIAYAKILILKQVTTIWRKKQQESCCYCLCKDTNSQASHNSFLYGAMVWDVVIAYAKILILKQVTTVKGRAHNKRQLLLPMQRYQFSSKSQRKPVVQIAHAVVIAYAKIANIYKTSKCKLKKKIFSYNSSVMLYKMVINASVIYYKN